MDEATRAASEARRRERDANARADSAARGLEIAKAQQDLISKAVGAVTAFDTARLSPAEESQLRALIDSLSSDDTPTRRGARQNLAAWLAALPADKQSATIELLFDKLSRKSYRFQVGVAQAIGDQLKPITIANPEKVSAEIAAAQKGPGGRDVTLRNLLQKAEKSVKAAKTL
jgi:hypothetical protein